MSVPTPESSGSGEPQQAPADVSPQVWFPPSPKPVADPDTAVTDGGEGDDSWFPPAPKP